MCNFDENSKHVILVIENTTDVWKATNVLKHVIEANPTMSANVVASPDWATIKNVINTNADTPPNGTQTVIWFLGNTPLALHPFLDEPSDVRYNIISNNFDLNGFKDISITNPNLTIHCPTRPDMSICEMVVENILYSTLDEFKDVIDQIKSS